MEDESTEDHLGRITKWFSESIESGVPILFCLSSYRRTSDGRQSRMMFGHHVVVTSLDGAIERTDGGTAVWLLRSGISQPRPSPIDAIGIEP